MNVLLVEDEPRVADFIDRGLRAENHGVTVAQNGGDGIDLAKTGDFDVIILDLMLPDMHGYDVCQRLRQDGQHTPILMLTAMDAIEDKIKGIKIGADDYLTKPFDFDELLVRIEALVRRSHNFTQRSNVLTVGDLKLDRELLEVTRGGESIPRQSLLPSRRRPSSSPSCMPTTRSARSNPSLKSRRWPGDTTFCFIPTRRNP